MTISQDKNLVIKQTYPCRFNPKLRIAKGDDDSSDTATPTLNFEINPVDIDEDLVERVKTFAENYLPEKWVVTEEYLWLPVITRQVPFG